MQVIEEIEEMMQDSPDPEDDESPSQSDLSMLSQDLHGLRRSGSNTSYEDRECGSVSITSRHQTTQSADCSALCACCPAGLFHTLLPCAGCPDGLNEL